MSHLLKLRLPAPGLRGSWTWPLFLVGGDLRLYANRLFKAFLFTCFFPHGRIGPFSRLPYLEVRLLPVIIECSTNWTGRKRRLLFYWCKNSLSCRSCSGKSIYDTINILPKSIMPSFAAGLYWNNLRRFFFLIYLGALDPKKEWNVDAPSSLGLAGAAGGNWPSLSPLPLSLPSLRCPPQLQLLLLQGLRPFCSRATRNNGEMAN